MYWEKDVETLNRAKLEKMQLAQLKETIDRAGKVFLLRQNVQRKRIECKSAQVSE